MFHIVLIDRVSEVYRDCHAFVVSGGVLGIG